MIALVNFAALAAFALLSANPGPEALALGRQVAASGSLATLLPLVQAKETEELLAEDHALTPAQRTRVRAIAARSYGAAIDRLNNTIGKAYAERLSVDDMRALVAFNATPAAQRYRAAAPEAIVEAMQSLGNLDLKGDVRKQVCAEMRHLCDH